MKFFTPIHIPNQENKIYCNSKILTLGSCFSDNIGNQLSNHLFDALVNPFGTIFNPISISRVLDLVVNSKLVESSDLDVEGSRYFHYDFHTSFDHVNPNEVVNKINQSIINTRSYLQNVDFLIITFGTSIVYRLNKDNRIVSNCHKAPNKKFSKEFLPVDIMEERMTMGLDAIKQINPHLKVILTVSPVRHTKEGLIENNLSKSRLIELSHRLVQKEEAISYFPAYEIMMDELRDYRYYGPDLIHPNEQAINIIWKKFMESLLDNPAIQKVKDIGALNLAKNHIPFDPKSNEHIDFRINQKKRIKTLKDSYPEVNFQELEQFFSD